MTDRPRLAVPRLDAQAADGSLVRLSGAWRLEQLAQVAPPPALAASTQVDATALTALDSAAALVLLDLLEDAGAHDLRWQGLSPAHERVIQAVQRARTAPAPAAAPRRRWVADVGHAVAHIGELLHGHLNFIGRSFGALATLAARPGRLRVRELTVQIEQTGINAIGVVVLVTFLIGLVVAYLLGQQASQYGANIFVVDGVAIGATREFAPIIVAIVVAGRSGAAFAAQLGAMRLNEETDAMRTLGLDPMQVLVLPRLLALMLAMPLLVFVGDIASLAGAMVITGSMLDIMPSAFIARLHEELALRHVLIGLGKAPVFAFAIAVIGTGMGMTVARDTRALGAATTSTVVQSIVAVILIDAAAAVLMQLLQL